MPPSVNAELTESRPREMYLDIHFKGEIMVRVVATVLLAGGLSSCAHMERIDKTYTSKDPAFQRTYAKPTEECVSASVKSLKDMGAPVESQTDSELVTERYDAYQFAVTRGGISPAGSVNAKTQINRQQAKLYLDFSREGNGCKVHIARVRAWNNGQEFEQLDVDFTKNVVVQPFFSELTERLSRQ